MEFLEYFLANERGNLIHKPLAYFPVYEKYFASLRGNKIKLLEIGVENGGSLQMWKQYFHPASVIVGIDINPACKQFEQPGIKIYTGDQGDHNFLKELVTLEGMFDIIIDDGGHHPHQQKISFEQLYPVTKHLYICEDLGTNYKQDYGGGIDYTSTFIGFTKRMIDQLMAYENTLQPDDFTENTSAIHIYENIFVFEKGKRRQMDTMAIGINRL